MRVWSSAVMASPIASTSSSAFSRVARAWRIRSCAPGGGWGVPPGGGGAVRAFGKAFPRRLSPTDLQERTPEELLAVVVGAFELVDGRTAGGGAVRGFEPSLA